MMKYIDRFVDKVVLHNRLILVITILITCVMAVFFFKQKHDNSIERFFFKDDPVLLQYQEIRDKIGSDELVVVAFQKENLFTNENLQIVRDLTQAIKNIGGVRSVYSLTEILEAEIMDDEITVQKIIPDNVLSNEQLSKIKNKISRLAGYNHFFKRTANSDTTIIIAELEQLTVDEKADVCIDIMNITGKVSKNRAILHHTGVPIIMTEMDIMTKRDIYVLAPIAGVIIFFITMFLLRNMTLSTLAMMTLAITAVWGIGLFVLCGETFSFPTTILLPVLVALSIADSIHLISHFLDSYHNDPSLPYEEKVAMATKAVWIPCLFTTLTTAVGFFSFVTSPIQPIFMLGIFTGIGILFAFVIDMTFLPSALVVVQEVIVMEDIGRSFLDIDNGKKRNRFFLNVLDKLGTFSTTHVWGLALTFAIITLFVITGMTKLRFESNPLNYLADSNKIKSDLVFIEKHFGGVMPGFMVIRSEKDLDFTSPDVLMRIEKIQKNMLEKNSKYIHNAYSIVDYVKEMNRAVNHNDDSYYSIPENRSDILDYYELNPYPDILRRMISRDHREAYITSLAVGTIGSVEEWLAVIEDKETKGFLREVLGDDFSYGYTGLGELSMEVQNNLKISEIQSIIIAFILIFIMMLFVCKNIKLAIIGMIPNIFPIITTLGVMGWLNVPLNEVTIMVAAVCLGIAVDDTVHFIVWFRRNVDSGMNNLEALRKSFRVVGKPLVVTTVMLTSSFLVLIFANFKPIQTYGVLTAFTMVTALIGDFFLLPALILIFKPKVAGSKADSKEEDSEYYMPSYESSMEYVE